MGCETSHRISEDSIGATHFLAKTSRANDGPTGRVNYYFVLILIAASPSLDFDGLAVAQVANSRCQRLAGGHRTHFGALAGQSTLRGGAGTSWNHCEFIIYTLHRTRVSHYFKGMWNHCDGYSKSLEFLESS